jgi:Ca-activated chloride channel homolog
MYRLESPDWLYFLLLLPTFVLLVEGFRVLEKKKLLAIFSISSGKLLSDFDVRRFRLKYVTWSLAIALLILALANPQRGDKLMEIESNQRDLFIALDVSNSMLARDVVPSRLEKSKQILLQLLQKLENTRIGLIVFAGKAYLQMPLTADINSAMVFVKSANPDMVGVQGTAIRDAVQLTNTLLEQSTSGRKSMILVSDGEDHQEDFRGVSNLAAEEGISIVALGVGSADGAEIPVEKGDIADVKRDEQGKPVLSRFNSELLKSLAKYGEGQYFDIDQETNIVEKIKSSLVNLETSTQKSRYTTYESFYQWLLVAALAVLLLERWMSSRVPKKEFA